MMDPTVLGQLVDEHAAALELYARQWCTAPEDVVQDAFLKLVTQSPLPRRVAPRNPCARRVIRRASADEIRTWGGGVARVLTACGA